MANRSKIYIPPATSVRIPGPDYRFVFSEDIGPWMHSAKLKHTVRQRDYDRKQRGGRIDKNSWG